MNVLIFTEEIFTKDLSKSTKYQVSFNKRCHQQYLKYNDMTYLHYQLYYVM